MQDMAVRFKRNIMAKLFPRDIKFFLVTSYKEGT